MDIKKLMQKYRARLVMEGLLKSLFFGLIVGFAVNAVYAVIAWNVGYSVWLGLAFWAAVALVTAGIVYFAVYRPSEKRVIARVDALGLEERILTMNALAGDDSYMAVRQREDTLAALKTVNEKMLKFAVSVPLMIALAVAGTLSFGATAAFAAIEKPEAPAEQYQIIYRADGDGSLLAWASVMKRAGAEAYIDSNGVLTIAASEKVTIADAENLQKITEDGVLKTVVKHANGQYEVDPAAMLARDEVISNGVTVKAKTVREFVIAGNAGIPVMANPDTTAATNAAVSNSNWMKPLSELPDYLRIGFSDDGGNNYDDGSLASATYPNFAPASASASASEQNYNIFVGWSDGANNPFRFEESMSGNVSVRAIFREAVDGADNPENDDRTTGSGSGEGDASGDSSGSDMPMWDGGEPQPSREPGEGGDGAGPGGTNGDIFEDGKKHLSGEEWKNAYENAQQDMQNNDGLSAEERALIEGYYKAIEQ